MCIISPPTDLLLTPLYKLYIWSPLLCGHCYCLHWKLHGHHALQCVTEFLGKLYSHWTSYLPTLYPFQSMRISVQCHVQNQCTPNLVFSALIYFDTFISSLMPVKPKRSRGQGSSQDTLWRMHSRYVGGEGELHLVTATAAVYSLKIFECSELVTAKTG